MEQYCDQLHEATAELLPSWRVPLEVRSRDRLLFQPHGDMPRWLAAVSGLPDIDARLNALQDRICLMAAEGDVPEEDAISTHLRQLMPWRKGPFDIFGVKIDTEWRSDWKWQRIAPHISSLAGRTVLDVGCGSGYHCWRMWAEGARTVLGIDPTLLYFFQYLCLKRYLPSAPVWYAPVRLEEMPLDSQAFDTVFSMGVLYHRRSPLDHIAELFSALKPGGELILETLVVEGDVTTVLMPADRYAAMRNVFFLPATEMLELWLRRIGFVDVRTVDVCITTVEEQHSTEWMTFQSLSDFLDPADPSRTIEGYPAPCRATLIARRP
ncbi:MAG: tRNA 5-methoxyuridine(34)/uridine 5-oxyacetic acid(34) synthase CmoB [Alcanivoracaceae bacterium]|nr:tRNA 5-methoxyuridine(34)/uridine 5-oxyacetic acid(34) synthase CmoB [Alcanivoracaceae bacterium]